MKQFFFLSALVLMAVGCASTPTPAPTAAPTQAPTALPQPTTAPTATALPPTPTQAPTNTTVPPTNTPLPTTPAPTATRTRAPVTRLPTVVATVNLSATVTVTATTTPAALKYPAPELIEPAAGQVRRAGGEDLIFSWRPVASLGTNECYLLTLRVTNTVDNYYAEQSFIASDTCGNPGDTPAVKFTVKRRPPAPDYAGLVEIAASRTPANTFTATWTVTVVQNNGADPNKPDPAQYVPLSPRSAPFEFSLQG